jgi:hypothetical protein
MRRARLYLGIGLAVLGAACFAPSAMAAPSNDSYPIGSGSTARVPINTTYFQRGGTDDATVQGNERMPPTCPDMVNTVWYRLKDVTGPVRISTDDDDTTFDTVVAVYEATADGSPGAFVGCDDDSGSGVTSNFVAPTRAGREYMVQIGGCSGLAACGNAFGGLAITFLGNDSRLTPEELTDGERGTRTNWYATLADGEVHNCGANEYGSTVWFRFRSPRKGTLNFTASGADMVVSVYRGNSPTPTRCSGDPIPGTLGSSVSVGVEQDTYLIQVGGRNAEQNSAVNVALDFLPDNDVDRDGSPIGLDCDDGDGRRTPGKFDIPFNNFDENCDGKDSKDGDGDHYDARPFGNDCNDGDHGINPTAREVPGNRIDENCDDRKAPGNLSNLNIDLKANRFAPGKLIFGRLRVSPVRKGYKIVVKCKGGRSKGCKRASLTKRIRRGRNFQTNFTYAKVLRNGAAFEVTVTWPGQNRIGQFKRFKVRKGRLRQGTCAMVPTDETGRAFRRSCR